MVIRKLKLWRLTDCSFSLSHLTADTIVFFGLGVLHIQRVDVRKRHRNAYSNDSDNDTRSSTMWRANNRKRIVGEGTRAPSSDGTKGVRPKAFLIISVDVSIDVLHHKRFQVSWRKWGIEGGRRFRFRCSNRFYWDFEHVAIMIYLFSVGDRTATGFGDILFFWCVVIP